MPLDIIFIQEVHSFLLFGEGGGKTRSLCEDNDGPAGQRRRDTREEEAGTGGHDEEPPRDETPEQMAGSGGRPRGISLATPSSESAFVHQNPAVSNHNTHCSFLEGFSLLFFFSIICVTLSSSPLDCN